MEDLQGHRATAKANSADAMTHCKKFGIPFSKFSADKLKAREVTRPNLYKDQDLIAYFGFNSVKYVEKTGPAVVDMEQSVCLTGANLTTDFSNILYFFDENQDMSIVHALYPLFGLTYNATNNPYGQIIENYDPTTTEYQTHILHMKMLGTAWTVGLMSSFVTKHVIDLFAASFNRSADFGYNWSGDEVTAAQGFDTEDWPACNENLGICYDTGHVAGAEVLEACEYAIQTMLYGE